jgi:hypothetical protein
MTPPHITIDSTTGQRDDSAHPEIAVGYVRDDLHAKAVAERDNLAALIKRHAWKLPADDPFRKTTTEYLRRIGAFNPLRRKEQS